jgi:hypothetical protein
MRLDKQDRRSLVLWATDCAEHAANYAVTAARFPDAAVPTDSAAATAKERDWQYRRLPNHLRPEAFEAVWAVP